MEPIAAAIVIQNNFSIESNKCQTKKNNQLQYSTSRLGRREDRVRAQLIKHECDKKNNNKSVALFV